MTIDEAIKIKEKYRRERCYGMTPLEIQADDLSIKALDAHRKARQPPYPAVPYLLPGETEK